MRSYIQKSEKYSSGPKTSRGLSPTDFESGDNLQVQAPVSSLRELGVRSFEILPSGVILRADERSYTLEDIAEILFSEDLDEKKKSSMREIFYWMDDFEPRLSKEF